MMKIGIVLVVGLLVCSVYGETQASLSCDDTPIAIEAEWADMNAKCTTMVRDQVQMELRASMTYLSMGSYFSKDTVNRPGFAEKFFASAGEEREHAIKLINYLLMRGELVSELKKLITHPTPYDYTWSTGLHALETALKLEVDVMNSIRKIIKVCEDDTPFNDYHLVDYLTADFLDEQYRGQRELAGEIEILGKMYKSHEIPLAEFLFDKKLLNGEPL